MYLYLVSGCLVCLVAGFVRRASPKWLVLCWLLFLEFVLSLFVFVSAGSIIGILGGLGVSQSVEAELVGGAGLVMWMLGRS